MKIFSKFIKLFSLSLIILGFYFYFNEKIQFSNYRIILFVIFPILLGLILLFVNTNNKLIIFNTIVIFGIFSIGIEIYFLQKKNEKTANKIFLEKNEDIPQLCGTFFKNIKDLDIYPLGGISNIPVKLENKFSKKITIENTDNFGFKNPIKWSIDNEINFMFIGDSFTYGADVAHKEGFVDYFTLNYPNTINLGCGGTGPIIQRGIFSEYVKKIKPNYVIWNLNLGNDINSDLPSELKTFYSNYLDFNFSQNLIIKQSLIDNLHKNYWTKYIEKKNKEIEKFKSDTDMISKININFISILKLSSLRNFLGLKFSFSQSSFEIFKIILNEVKKDTEIWNGKLIVNVIPSDQKFISIFHELDYNSYNNRIINYLRNNGFDYIDLNDYFNKSNYTMYFDGHFTLAGNKLVSDIILKRLSD